MTNEINIIIVTNWFAPYAEYITIIGFDDIVKDYWPFGVLLIFSRMNNSMLIIFSIKIGC